jgi:hypothetical protein
MMADFQSLVGQYSRAKRDDTVKARKRKFCIRCMGSKKIMVRMDYSNGIVQGSFRRWEVDVYTCPVCGNTQKEHFPIGGKGCSGREIHFESSDRLKEMTKSK